MDPAGYVFLGRAVELIGKAMFGREWLGDETVTDLATPPAYEKPRLTVLPSKPGSFSEQLRAHNILRRHHPGTRPDISKGALGAYSLQFTEEEWKTAREIHNHENAATEKRLREAADRAGKVAEEHNVAALPKLRRLVAVQREIIKRCESGELVAAYRPSLGGAMTFMKPEWWNTDHWSPRFFACEFDPMRPFSPGTVGASYCKIFIQGNSLERLLLSKPFSELTHSTLGHISPYLKLMLFVASKWKVTPENQPPKLALEAEIKTTWSGTQPLSDRLANAMATLIREPEIQAGRTKKKVR